MKGKTTRPFHKLQSKMYDMGISKSDLKEIIGVSCTYITNRFNRSCPFTINDIYKICEVLEIPRSEISEYFPEKD